MQNDTPLIFGRGKVERHTNIQWKCMPFKILIRNLQPVIFDVYLITVTIQLDKWFRLRCVINSPTLSFKLMQFQWILK